MNNWISEEFDTYLASVRGSNGLLEYATTGTTYFAEIGLVGVPTLLDGAAGQPLNSLIFYDTPNKFGAKRVYLDPEMGYDANTMQSLPGKKYYVQFYCNTQAGRKEGFLEVDWS